jgi:hypothetical protein
MTVSTAFLTILVWITLLATIAAPIILVCFWIREWRRGTLW